MKGDDVRKKLQEKGFVLNEVAKSMKITPQSLQSLLNSEDIKTGVLERIGEAINRNIYFFFESPKDEIDQKKSIYGFKVEHKPELDQTKSNPTKSVPYWNLPVRAGRSLEEVIGQTKPDGYVAGLPGADMAENILPVVGTSMDPEVSDGALIGVRKMNNWETLNTERIYLIITREERMIKRIEHDIEDEGILWCTSPNYKKFKIYKSDIIEIQRVCFVYNPK